VADSFAIICSRMPRRAASLAQLVFQFATGSILEISAASLCLKVALLKSTPSGRGISGRNDIFRVVE
jgi:hypothetical protein